MLDELIKHVHEEVGTSNDNVEQSEALEVLEKKNVNMMEIDNTLVHLELLEGEDPSPMEWESI